MCFGGCCLDKVSDYYTIGGTSDQQVGAAGLFYILAYFKTGPDASEGPQRA
jgi:hypothetical protein